MANGILKRLGEMFTVEQTDTPPLLATDTQKEEKVVQTKKRNERAYKRCRGKGGSKGMTYYVPD